MTTEQDGLRKRVIYKGHEIYQPLEGNFMEMRYWHFRPLPGTMGFTGKVYASLKEARKAIDYRIKKGEPKQAAPAAPRPRERSRKKA